MSIMHFASANVGGLTASLVGDTLINTSLSPTNAEVAYQLVSTGEEQSREGVAAGFSTINTWLTSIFATGADYECRLTVNSGDNPTGSALATWLALSSTRTWTLTQSSPGAPLSNNCTIQIRSAGTQAVLATATVTMFANEEL